MFLSWFLVLLPAFLSLSARALPHSRTASRTAPLKLAVRFISDSVKSIVDADRSRVKALLEGSGSSSISENNTGSVYTANIGVGSPPTYYTLLIDTGSSNTWIGAGKSYVKTSTSNDTGGRFGVTYGDNSKVSGEEYLDTVMFNSDLVIEKQSIGVADSGSDAGLGADDLHGILGVGPRDLTQDTVSNAYEVPTVMDNLRTQGKISSEVLGVFFAPASADDASGELTFGGYDSSRITGGMNYVQITTRSPSSNYWGVDLSISYGEKEILGRTAGIVDTGTTLVPIATDAFNQYKAATGATLDDNTGLLMISSEQYSKLSSLYFNIGGTSYEFTANAQIWPRSLNSALGGTSDGIYLVVTDNGSPSGSGLDFIAGYCFLERFYSVYDTTNSRVGFATTEYTNATSN